MARQKGLDMALIFEFRKVGTVKKMTSIRIVLLHENGLRENLRHREQNAKINLYKYEGKKFDVVYEYIYYNKQENKFELIEEKVAFKDRKNYIKFVPIVVQNSPNKEVKAKSINDCEWAIYCVGFE